MVLNLCQYVTAVICVWGVFEMVMPSPATDFGSRQKRQDANMSDGDNHTESIEDTELCQDRGQSYVGKINVTRLSKKCLPWSEVTTCPYHPFQVNSFNTLLEENYCRNPDQKTGTQPWCYTEQEFCVRDNCDVCPLDVKISCGPPPAVSDGELIDAPQASYSVGDKVLYRCSLWNNTRERICLTSGNWSVLGFVCGVCPDGWTLFNGKCYSKLAQLLKFENAKQACQEVDAEITSAKSKEENDFLEKNFYVSPFWIDLTRQETVWLWGDGQRLEFKNWGKAYPYMNSNDTVCAAMAGKSTWRDDSCKRKRAVVCSVTAGGNFTEGEASCADYWDACPRYFQDNGNLCVEFPDFAMAQCRYTCGLCDIDATPQCVVEAPGANATVMESRPNISRGETVTYACHEGFDPLHGDISRGCDASGTLLGTPLECSPGCKEGWTFFRETQSCYKYIDDPTDYLTARLYCKSLEGYIAMPKTPEQNAFVDKIRLANDSSKTDIWIGLNDLAIVNTFVWDDGEQLTDSRWMQYNANQSEPSEQTGDNCGSMNTRTYWADRKCFLTFNFVCQVPKNKSSANINEMEPCPQGWNLTDGICYKLAAELLNYNRSKQVCEFEDAHLPTPKSQEANDFLVNTFGNMFWLGFNDIAEEGNWLGEDGRPISFENWRRDQPPREDNLQNCAGLNDAAEWIDISCERKRQVVCQKPAQDVGGGESGNAELEVAVGA